MKKLNYRKYLIMPALCFIPLVCIACNNNDDSKVETIPESTTASTVSITTTTSITTIKTTAQVTTTVYKPDMSKYIGCWQPKNEDETELRVYSSDKSSVVFSLWCLRNYESEKITAKIKNNNASFKGEDMQGDITFEKDKITFKLKETNAPNLKPRTIVFDLQKDTAVPTESVDESDSENQSEKAPSSELSQETLYRIADELGVPSGSDIYFIQGTPYWWEGAAMWITDVSVMYNDYCVAGATVDSYTGEILKSIHMYDGFIGGLYDDGRGPDEPSLVYIQCEFCGETNSIEEGTTGAISCSYCGFNIYAESGKLVPNVWCPNCGYGWFTTGIGAEGLTCNKCGTNFMPKPQ